MQVTMNVYSDSHVVLPTVNVFTLDFEFEVRNEDVELTVAVQLQLPDCSLPNELTNTVLVYLVGLLITGVLSESVTLSGPVNTVFTITAPSMATAGLSSTVQVRVTSDPAGWMGVSVSLDTVTEVGAGTMLARRNKQLN